MGGASRIPATPKSAASARFRKRCVACIRRFSSLPVRTLELDVVDSAAAGLPTMGRTLMLQPPHMAKHEQFLLLVDLSLRRSAPVGCGCCGLGFCRTSDDGKNAEQGSANTC